MELIDSSKVIISLGTTDSVMSITQSESVQPDSIHSSGGAKELTDQSRGDSPLNGTVDELRPIASRMTIASNNWGTAEEAAREIIQKVRPTSESEETRREVIGYIQSLIRKYLGIEVLPYGSVPLRTYLPDGDIDLTAFGGANVEELLVDDMKFVLEREEKNTASEFAVKDVQLIRAEVKLVKCIVQNIVVDVSFNQIGGLSTLCFLEQIDRVIGKDHLFKSSIILIKAWCYYESRILGAHHGLISTYALETLVLYIFHLYHSTLDGPLSVLYKFLDYFSKFDWDTYGISLNGLVRLSSLPDIIVEMPEDSDGNLLLSGDFLSSCVDMLSVSSRGGDQSSRGFQLKHLNIVDPLKETNNLGRSVSKGNFYRVRSAFTYGAKKLAQILSQPENIIANELPKFFPNTMARHGSIQSPHIHDLHPSISQNMSISTPPVSDICEDDNSASEDFDKATHSTVLLDNPKPISPSHRLSADASDLATSSLESLILSPDSCKSQNQVQTETVNLVGKFYYAPHQFFAKSKSQKGSSTKNVDQDSDKSESKCESPEKDKPVEKDDLVGPNPSSFSNHVQVSSSSSATPESLNSLADLTGDYDSYFQCLQYGRWCYEYTSGMQSPHIPSSPNAPYQNIPWEGTVPPLPFKRNGFSNQHRNGFHQSPAVYPAMPHMVMPGVAFGWEEMPKPRGTGTYFPNFPNMNQTPQGYRPSTIPGMNKASSRQRFNNGRNMIYQILSMEKTGQEPPQSQISASFDDYQAFSPRGNEYPNNPNGFSAQPEGIVEFGSVGHGSGSGASISETNKHQKPVSSSPRTLSGMQKSPPAFSKEQDRILARSSYHLKDQDDFPPL